MLTRLASAATLMLTLTSAWALEGKTAIYAPTTITTSGSYILTRNISGAAPLITIAASDVELDLNGFTLEATSATGYVVTASNVDRLRIRNGRTKAGVRGISLELVDAAEIRDVIVDASTSSGISLYQVKDFLISNCSIENAGGPGILADLSTFSGQGVIERNRIRNAGLDGIVLTSVEGGLIERNVVIDVGQNGIWAQGSESLDVNRNTVIGATAAGIAIPSGAATRVVENIVRGNGSNGIQIGAADATVLGNVITTNTEDGLFVFGDQSLIAGNQAVANGMRGLHFSSAADRSVYRLNVARGDLAGGPACGAAGGTNDFCNEGAVNSSPNDNFMPSRM